MERKITNFLTHINFYSDLELIDQFGFLVNDIVRERYYQDLREFNKVFVSALVLFFLRPKYSDSVVVSCYHSVSKILKTMKINDYPMLEDFFDQCGLFDTETNIDRNRQSYLCLINIIKKILLLGMPVYRTTINALVAHKLIPLVAPGAINLIQ